LLSTLTSASSFFDGFTIDISGWLYIFAAITSFTGGNSTLRLEDETYHPCLSSESVELKISIPLAGIVLCFSTVKIVKIIVGGKRLGILRR